MLLYLLRFKINACRIPLIFWISGYVVTDVVFENSQNFPRLSVAAILLLRIKEVAVDFEFKRPLTAHNKRKIFDNMLIVR